jgi:ribosome modulation factor
VPVHLAHFDERREIVKALKTSSPEVAKLRRDSMERADDLYWQSGILGNRAGSEASYQAAKARVVGLGFEYKSAADIAASHQSK